METESAPSFDRATYTTGGGGAPCAKCKAPIRDRYWRLNNQIFCATCHEQIAAAVAAARAQGSFGRALLLGGGTALGCGIAYAIFVQVSSIQLALITIGIAYLVAKVVRRASGGLSGRRFQILAVLLTYVASAMGYAGPVLHEMSELAHKHAAAKDKQAAGDSATTIAKADDARPEHARGSAFGFAFAPLVVFAIILAAPVLAATQAPIGLLIIAIGLYEAWKLSRPVVIQIDGPYDISSGAAPVA